MKALHEKLGEAEAVLEEAKDAASEEKRLLEIKNEKNKFRK